MKRGVGAPVKGMLEKGTKRVEALHVEQGHFGGTLS